MAVRVNTIKRVVGRVGVEIPALRMVDVRVEQRLICAREPSLSSRHVSGAEVVESVLDVPFFRGELPAAAAVRAVAWKRATPAQGNRDLLTERQVVEAADDGAGL